jgi:penicillin amidase
MIVGVRRVLSILLGSAAVVTISAAAGAYFYARRSLPETNGTIQVAGLSAPVDIVRDADAIPHIFAATRADGFFGLGYAHAQDRLWQMEFQRRIGFGRLSEIFGPTALPQDRFLRTVGFGRAAKSAWTTMPERARKDIEAYVAGINAFLTGHHGSALPPEFTLLGFEPDSWSGADVIVWQKMMAWDLAGNYSFELLRHDIAGAVGAAGLADLMPPYPEDGLSILGPHWAGGARQTDRTRGAGAAVSADASRSYQPLQPRDPGVSWAGAFNAALSLGEPAVRDFLLGGTVAEALGSNNWVVDGTLTASGKPLLANDPHLSARAPSIWYLAHVSAGDYDAIGATLPGAPGIILGRNRFIAWGATNVAADVEDLYREKIDETGRFAEFQHRQEPLQFIPETILVKGQSPVRIDVRLSRHGPLVSDAINAVNAASPKRRSLPPVEPLAFRWTALDPTDTTIAALLKLGEARNWNDFTAALGDFVVPSQNFVYADVDGHIGYVAPGRIPVRATGDGALPADGWTGASEWTGWVPVDELPHVYDPSDHVIVTANHRPAPPAYPHLLGLEWVEPYRAQRITELLRKPRLTPDDFAVVQRDTLSLHAKAVLPTMLEHMVPHEKADEDAIRILRRWNYEARGDSAAATIFEAWFLRLAPTLVGDDLGPLTTENYQGRYSFVTRFVLNVLNAASPRTGSANTTPYVAPSYVVSGFSRTSSAVPSGVSRTWCDDIRTPQTETCADAVGQALHEAVSDLTRRLGKDVTRWRWDGVHRATFPHQGLDSVGLLRPLISRSSPGAGDWSTVDVGAVAADQPYEQHTISSYREIIDLSPANDSRFIDALGQSGHFLSPHYDDFLEDWRTVRHRRMRMDRADVENGAIGHLRLTPR